MILLCLTLQMTSLPHSGLAGIMYLLTSSKLKRDLLREAEGARRGENLKRESGRDGIEGVVGDTTATEILEARELTSECGAVGTGDDAYEPELELDADVGPGAVAIRPSGT